MYVLQSHKPKEIREKLLRLQNTKSKCVYMFCVYINQICCNRKRIFLLNMLQWFYNMIEDRQNSFDKMISSFGSQFLSPRFDMRCLYCISGLTFYQGSRSHLQCPGSRVLSLMCNDGSGSRVSNLTFRVLDLEF